MDLSIQSGVFEKDRSWFSTRYVICALSFIGLFHTYALRVNLSVAIVAMVDAPAKSTNSTSTNPDTCPIRNSSSKQSAAAEFDWDGNAQGLILGAFFYGYIITQLPGAWIAHKFGAKYPLQLSIFVSGVLALLTPLVTRWSYFALVAIRVVQGSVLGICFPAMHTLLARWCPPMERTKMCMTVYTGSHVGTVVTLLVSGFLGDYFGWSSIFYVFGTSSVLWCVLWHFCAFDSPENHPRISVSERSYIVTSRGPSHITSTTKTPWKEFFFSLPVWAICIAHFGNSWGFYTLLTNLPTYLSRILHFSLRENGVTAALPYALSAICMPLSGLAADYLRLKGTLSTMWVRRIFHFSGQLIPAISLVAVGYIGCDVWLAVGLLTLAVGGNALSMAGFYVNHIDISPSYAGVLMGLSNTLGTIPGMAGPAVVGLLTGGPEGHTISQWRMVFYITAAVYMSTAVFYCLCSSGDLAPWERQKKHSIHLEPENRCRRTSCSVDFT